MGDITLVNWFAALSQALPPLAGVVRGVRSRAHRFIIVASLLTLTSDVLARVVALRGQHNLWVWNIFGPPFAAALLLALAEWQRTEFERLALRIAAPVTALAWVALVATVEDSTGFGQFVGPMHALVLLAAALWTWVRRAAVAEGSLLRADWFWAAGAIALYGASTAAIEPLAAYLIEERGDLVHRAFTLRAALHGVVFVLLAWSILCPTPAKRSGPSSSPPASA